MGFRRNAAPAGYYLGRETAIRMMYCLRARNVTVQPGVRRSDEAAGSYNGADP